MEHSWAEHSGAGRTVPTVYNNVRCAAETFVRTVYLQNGRDKSLPYRIIILFSVCRKIFIPTAFLYAERSIFREYTANALKGVCRYSAVQQKAFCGGLGASAVAMELLKKRLKIVGLPSSRPPI